MALAISSHGSSSATSGRWLLATYLFPSTDDQMSRVQAIVEHEDPAQTLTGLPVVNQELARTFTAEFLKGLAVGAVLVVLLVLAAFRSWRLCLFALLPTAMGLTWTGGILALAGIELDLFAAFAVVTLLGIGVDYGVHLVHRSHERGDAAKATAELAPVILVAAAITILGYGTLVTSSYPPLALDRPGVGRQRRGARGGIRPCTPGAVDDAGSRLTERHHEQHVGERCAC